MPDIPTTLTTVDLATGEQHTEAVPMHLMPPAAGLCQECAYDHAPADPHNEQMLYYQMAFHGKHGRYPTWHDAMAHCDDTTKQLWLVILRRMGVDV